MLRGSVKGTGYPLHSPVSPSLPLPCVTVCHHVSIGLYSLLYSLSYQGTPNSTVQFTMALATLEFKLGMYSLPYSLSYKGTPYSIAQVTMVLPILQFKL